MAKNGKNDVQAAASMPDGFRRRTSVSDAPWLSLETGNTMTGRLVGRFLMQGTEPIRAYYQVELTSGSVKVRKGSGDDAEVVEAKAGDVINVNESAKIRYLKDKEIPEVLAGAEYDLWMRVGEKLKLKGGRTMWDIDSGVKMVKAPTSEVRPLPPDVATGGEAAAEEDAF